MDIASPYLIMNEMWSHLNILQKLLVERRSCLPVPIQLSLSHAVLHMPENSGHPGVQNIRQVTQPFQLSSP